MSMNNMGKAIPFSVRQTAYEHCLEMGLSKDNAMEAVSIMSEQLRRDKPYEAQQMVMKLTGLDLTGIYRLMAVLLTF